MINKITAMNLFERNSFLVVNNDVISVKTVERLTSKEAVEFAKRMKSGAFNGYGIGDYTLNYMNQGAFLTAVTYQNIAEIKRENIDYEAN